MKLLEPTPGLLTSTEEAPRAVLNAAPGTDATQFRPSLLRQVAAYASIARPDHWCKNVFMALGVLLAYFCHPELLSWQALPVVLWAFATTCIVASSNYVLNEILDAPRDRSHPSKKHRPIPAGLVWLPLAYAEWLALGVIGLLMASLVNPAFLVSSAALLAMGIIYNCPPIRSKELPYLDVLSESVNNPLRLLLGWFAVTAAEFPPLSLLLAYWMIGAFFMAAKRFAEYRMIGDAAVARSYRNSFRHYDEKRLLLSMVFYTTSFALFLGVFIIRYHLELILVFPLVAGFITYYLHIAFKHGSAAQAPEGLYREKGLMAYLILCVAAFVVLMLVHIPFLYELFNVTPSPVPPLWKV
jgi:4-hydroxybenzoate polyprenyltransferase